MDKPAQTSKALIGKGICITGYILSLCIGLVLWPRMLETGFHLRNSNFALALIFTWLCVPVTMCIACAVSWVSMRIGAFIDNTISPKQIIAHSGRAAIIGVLATLGSCGAIASGYEPQPPFDLIYQLD